MIYRNSHYATAKECVIKEAKQGCEIGQYINRDIYNPFCSSNEDPLLVQPGMFNTNIIQT